MEVGMVVERERDGDGDGDGDGERDGDGEIDGGGDGDGPHFKLWQHVYDNFFPLLELCARISEQIEFG